MAMTDEHVEVLDLRGLDVELCVSLGFDTQDGLYKAEGPNGTTEWRKTPCIAIPFVRDGQVMYFKRIGRRPDDGSRLIQRDRKNVPAMPWNEDCLRDDSLLGAPLVITEGEYDAVVALQNGWRRTISVPDGAPNPGEAADKPLHERPKYKWLEGIADLITIDRVPEVIIAGDGDEPGAQLLEDLCTLLGRFRCKFVTYPKLPEAMAVKLGRARCKDLNEVQQAYGAKGVRATLEGAKFVKVEGVYLMSELPPVPEPKRHKLPIEGMGHHYHLRFGDFVVITGVPSYGKSTWANDTYSRFADTYGLRVAVASFEQNPQIDHKRNLRSWFLQKPVWEATQAELDAADAWIDQHYTFLVPDDEVDVTLDWMLERLETAVIRHGCRIVIVDPWNEMDHMREFTETQTEYVGRAIKRLKRFARRFNVHLVVVAHPAKLQRAKDTGMFPKPGLYDISDSAHWNNKADLGIVVHREVEQIDGVQLMKSTVSFVKSRYHEAIGPIGEVQVNFDSRTRRFDYVTHVAGTTESQWLASGAYGLHQYGKAA